MKNTLLLIIALFVSFTAFGQDTDMKAKMYQAYLTADQAKWETYISQLENKYEQSNEAADLLILAQAQHASVSAFKANKDQEGAQNILDSAEKNTDIYLKGNSKSASANALLSAIYGMQIGMSPAKGMSLGYKSTNLIDKAIKNDPMNAFAQYQKGSSLYFTPRMWGGDVPKAIERLIAARELYEAQGVENEWNYLNVLAVLGQAYHYQENYDAAKKSYDSALAIAPDFGWVKYRLLPKLEGDME